MRKFLIALAFLASIPIHGMQYADERVVYDDDVYGEIDLGKLKDNVFKAAEAIAVGAIIVVAIPIVVPGVAIIKTCEYTYKAGSYVYDWFKGPKPPKKPEDDVQARLDIGEFLTGSTSAAKVFAAHSYASDTVERMTEQHGRRHKSRVEITQIDGEEPSNHWLLGHDGGPDASNSSILDRRTMTEGKLHV